MGFRFYGCSLLLIYDGDKTVQNGYTKDVNAIEALDSSALDTQPAVIRNVPLRAAESVSQEDEADEHAEDRHRPTRLARQGDDAQVQTVERRSRSADADASGPSASRHRSSHSHTHPRHHSHVPNPEKRDDNEENTPIDLADNTRRIRGEVNIRVVDFAHTTHWPRLCPVPSDIRRGYK